MENGGLWAKFYWSQNSGVYGHQVITECNIGEGFETSKTGGCGYCKKSQSLELYANKVLKKYKQPEKYKSLGGDLDWYLNRTINHVGGNEYAIHLDELENIDKIERVNSCKNG